MLIKSFSKNRMIFMTDFRRNCLTTTSIMEDVLAKNQ